MIKAAAPQLTSGKRLKAILTQNRRLGSGGVYSVCSAHPWVLEAAIQRAVEDDTICLVESTSAQVNQEGGYTGQTPEEFATSIRSATAQAGLAADQVLLGGDHLGPFPWRTQSSSVATDCPGGSLYPSKSQIDRKTGCPSAGHASSWSVETRSNERKPARV